MTENEVKAIKWIKNVRDDAVVTLDHIAKNEPNVSPMLYAGRKEKAETIINGFEELEQYRAIGTVEECREVKEELKKYKDTGLTPDQIKEIDKLYREKCEELAQFKPVKGKFYFEQQLYIKEEKENYHHGSSKKM